MNRIPLSAWAYHPSAPSAKSLVSAVIAAALYVNQVMPPMLVVGKVAFIDSIIFDPVGKNAPPPGNPRVPSHSAPRAFPILWLVTWYPIWIAPRRSAEKVLLRLR